jgi:hypothetical protein
LCICVYKVCDEYYLQTSVRVDKTK